MLALACDGAERSEVADAGAARICEGDHFAGDAATLAALAECTRVSGNLVFTGSELNTIDLSKLRDVDGSFSIWGNQNLSSAKSSQLARVGGYFLIEANERLADIDFPLLKHVNERSVMHHADFSIHGNPRLPTCQATALRDQLQAHAFEGSIDIRDNQGTCTD